MADIVFIAGVKRHGERLSLIELRQYLGRSGRRHGIDGRVDIFLNPEDESLEKELENGNEPVVSAITKEDYPFHLLPMISNGLIKNHDDCKKWWEKSFTKFTHKEPDWKDIIDYMKKEGWIEDFQVTPLGMISVDLLFYPQDINCWRDNLKWMFESKKENNDACLAFVVGNSKKYKFMSSFENHSYILDAYKEELGDVDVDAFPLMNCVLWWSMLGNCTCGQSGNIVVRDMRKDVGRVLSALKRLNLIYSFEKSGYLNVCEDWFRRGIPSKLRHLYTIDPNMTKNKAQSLVEAGVKNVDDYNDWGKDLVFDE